MQDVLQLRLRHIFFCAFGGVRITSPSPVPGVPYGLFIPLTRSGSSPTLGEQFAIRRGNKPQGLTDRRDSSPKVGEVPFRAEGYENKTTQ